MRTVRWMNNLGEFLLLGGISVYMIAENAFNAFSFTVFAVAYLLWITQDRLIGLFVAGWLAIVSAALAISWIAAHDFWVQLGKTEGGLVLLLALLDCALLFFKYRKKNNSDGQFLEQY
ncbi:MAG: hypothetical protein KGS48_11600 [Bacteroidetes bacterium]|nr:hypothetical protein [Bacteroidota bacterium]